MALRRNPLSDLVCRPHCSAHLRVRSMSRRARARRSADIPDPPVSTYTKHTWGWEIVRVLRDAQRAEIRAGMTEADILLVMANTITSRGNITEDKKKVPSYLNVLRSQLDLNKCGMFEKAGCLSPDCEPKQQLWKLVRNAQTENIPDVEKSTYVSYDDIDLERYQISEASAKYISLSEDDPVAKTRGEARARAAATTRREGPGARLGTSEGPGRARLEDSEGGGARRRLRGRRRRQRRRRQRRRRRVRRPREAAAAKAAARRRRRPKEAAGRAAAAEAAAESGGGEVGGGTRRTRRRRRGGGAGGGGDHGVAKKRRRTLRGRRRGLVVVLRGDVRCRARGARGGLLTGTTTTARARARSQESCALKFTKNAVRPMTLHGGRRALPVGVTEAEDARRG